MPKPRAHAAVVATAAVAPASQQQPQPSSTMGEPARLLCSRFLRPEEADDGDATLGTDQHLAVVLLNWTLPELTPRLWRRGAPSLRCAALHYTELQCFLSAAL